MNIKRGNITSRAGGGGVAFLLLLLTMLIPAAPSSAEVSPNKFVIDEHTISVLPSSGEARFYGEVSMALHLSDTGTDAIKMRVSGDLILYEAGCAQLRVNYLDDDKNLVPGKVEHSDVLVSPSQVEEVIEWSIHPDYRHVRLEVLYGPTCSSLSEIGQKTSHLTAEMSTLGDGERWVSGIAHDYASLMYMGGFADSVVIRWDAATNPAPTPDRGDARITALLSQSLPGCSKLQAKHYNSSGGYLGTTWSKEVCGPVPTKVTLSNFASNSALDRIVLRLRYDPPFGGISYSTPKTFDLD